MDLDEMYPAPLLPDLVPKTEAELRAEIERGRVYRLNDKFFKFAFGRPERKPLFLDLVNSIVFPDGERAFSDITFVDREFAPLRRNGKECHLDIVGILNDGEQINVEVQVLDRGDYKKRSVFYWSTVHCGQLERGGLYVDIRRTISVNILDFDLFKEEPNFRNSFSIRNDTSGAKLCDDMAMIYLEIPKYRRCGRQPVNKLERWMAYLAGQEGTTMRQIAETEPLSGEALDMERMFLMDRMERLAYIQGWKQVLDEANREETIRRLAEERGEERGMEQGMKRGEAKGAKETSISVARNLLSLGIPVDKIAQATLLSIEEIESLSQQG